MQNQTRKNLSTEALLSKVKEQFSLIGTPKGCDISTADCLMSAMAIYGMKAPSLLKFEERLQDENCKKNIKTLYQINKIPCDTYMRERIDKIKPEQIRSAYKGIFHEVQRGKILEQYTYLEEGFLVPLDGTEYYSSKEHSCENCCVKNHKNGTQTFFHQALCSVIVHPDIPHVLPLMPEPICRKDGDTKNDCEINAAKRKLVKMREDHPRLKLIITGDGLYSKGPHIELLTELGMHYILVAKETDHAYLFDWIKGGELTTHTIIEGKTTHKFEFVNQVPLNASHEDLLVNFLRYTEIKENGQKTTWTWVTDIPITIKNVYQIMRGGRARWKVENNTFNTLKNQGYNFEHNFGHGAQNLSNIMMLLMMLVFAIDQIQMLSNALFQAAKKRLGSYASLWEEIRVVMRYFVFNSWEELLHKITYNPKTFADGIPP